MAKLSPETNYRATLTLEENKNTLKQLQERRNNITKAKCFCEKVKKNSLNLIKIARKKIKIYFLKLK